MNKISILSDTTNIENQDRAKVVQRPNDDILIIVADGAGGISDGSKAAETAVRLAKNYVVNEQKFSEPDKWVRLLYDIDSNLLYDRNTGETTCVIAAVRKGFVCGASVGDSGAWCINDSDIADLTENQKRKPLLGTGLGIKNKKVYQKQKI